MEWIANDSQLPTQSLEYLGERRTDELVGLLVTPVVRTALLGSWELPDHGCGGGTAIGTLYHLLPPESRRRPVDPAGVARMPEALRRLSQ
jgi:hypothetical protein